MCFLAGAFRFLKEGFVFPRQCLLGIKCDDSADGIENLLSQTSTPASAVKSASAKYQHTSRPSAHYKEQSPQGRRADESQLPELDVRNDKRRHKSRRAGQCQGDLFRNTVLDQVCIGGNARCNLSWHEGVEKGYVLAQDGTQILDADFLDDVIAGVDEADSCDGDGDKLTDTKVNEIEDIFGEFVVEMVEGNGINRDLLKGRRELAEDDGKNRQCSTADNRSERSNNENEDSKEEA